MSISTNPVEEIKILGKTYFPGDAGYSVLLALDQDMSMLPANSHLDASFVLGLTLTHDGSVYLTQLEGMSADKKLMLTTVDDEMEITIGTVVELTNLFGLHLVEIRYPSGSGTLSFQRRVYPRNKKVLELRWERRAACCF